MTLLGKRKARAKRIEEHVREDIGIQITIEVKSNKRDCPVCTIDPFYNEPVEDCEPCNNTGYIYDTVDTLLYAQYFWDDQLQVNEIVGGKLEDGDCVIELSVDHTSLIESAINGIEEERFKITIEGNSFYAIKFITDSYGTKIRVWCKRIRN